MVEELILKIGSIVIESNTSGVELFEFVEFFRHECENKSLLRHDNFVGASTSGKPKWPHLMNFAQKYLSIPQVL